MNATPNTDRYDNQQYRRAGNSGLVLPPVSLGLWQNFGDATPMETQENIVLRAFDLGVTHFDLANNYGPPAGSAETNFGRILRSQLRQHRDELIVTTKAGMDMWGGPYGHGPSRKHMLASLDQSLRRLQLDYVDVFYIHRPDENIPIAESVSALATAYQQGKALYVGISNFYSASEIVAASEALNRWNIPLTLVQDRYSAADRRIEGDVLDATSQVGSGMVIYSPLEQGLLTDRYLHEVPAGSRADRGSYLSTDRLTDHYRWGIGQLAEMAHSRGQSIAQMALAWTLRDPRITSAIIGASSVAQLEANLAALQHPDFSEDELQRISEVTRGW